jgi:hypothetical protein
LRCNKTIGRRHEDGWVENQSGRHWGGDQRRQEKLGVNVNALAATAARNGKVKAFVLDFNSEKTEPIGPLKA